jgi:hypothetical protein
MEPKELTSEKQLRVLRGRVDSVNLYEVKENELEILENGEPTGIYLNFSIFLYSLSISTITSLCTATFTKSIVQNTFLFTSIIGIIGGTFLLILWWKGRKSIKSIITKIKNRIPADYVTEENSINPISKTEKIEDENNINPPAG